MAAADAGKHVFVQKPLAPTLRQRRTMADAARANGTQLVTSEPGPAPTRCAGNVMFGILLEHEYDGYVSAEPHGPYWAREPERRKAYIRHTLRMFGLTWRMGDRGRGERVRGPD